MEYVKNKTLENLTLDPLGIILGPEEIRDITEFADRTRLQLNATYLNDLIYLDKIIILDADYKEFSKVLSVQYISNGFSKVIIDVEKQASYNNYYFLKDFINLNKNESTEINFKGRVKSVFITSTTNDIDVQMVTGDRLRLPLDNLVKRQTLEFEFNGDVKDPTIEITSGTGHTVVEYFIEGYSVTDSPKLIQKFIDTSFKDETEWKTSDVVIVKIDTDKENLKTINIINEPTGNRIFINDNHAIDSLTYYKIYKITNKEFVIEFVENEKWDYWSPNRFRLKFKNTKFVHFNDVVIDLTNTTIYDYFIQHKLDGVN